MKAFSLLLLLPLVITAAKQRFGLYKPNLYFAVSERQPSPLTFGLAWIVKDWRTDKLLVRHQMQYDQPFENVSAYYTDNDGTSFASQVIIDHDYNAKITLDFIIVLDGWQVALSVEALDNSREIRIVSFWYIHGENKMPFSTSKE
jgi:hypothetical protein